MLKFNIKQNKTTILFCQFVKFHYFCIENQK